MKQKASLRSQGFVQILLIVGIVAALGVIGYVLFSKKISIQTPNFNLGSSVPPIQNASDLNKASASLDSASTAQMDTELNALNQASSGF